MLVFNEILEKGFEGSHFITGLAAHLRDLLVSRDAMTLPLLEVSDSIRARYQEQSQRCTPKFLYRAIKLCSDCDLNYRASKNKRLLVEITLIQLSQLTLEDDSVGSGRSPEKTLPPYSTNLPGRYNRLPLRSIRRSLRLPWKRLPPPFRTERHRMKRANPRFRTLKPRNAGFPKSNSALSAHPSADLNKE